MTIQTDKPGTLTMREAMYYTLSRPVSTVIIGCDTIAQLEENVQLARDFTPINDKQQTNWWRRPSRARSRRCSSASTTGRNHLRWGQLRFASVWRSESLLQLKGLLFCMRASVICIEPLASSLPQDPRRHAAIILHDGRLQRIDEHGIHLFDQVQEHLFVHQVPLRTVANDEAIAADSLEVHSDP